MNYSFKTAEEILHLTKKYKISIGELAKRYEAERTNKPVSAIRNKMKAARDVMGEAIGRGVNTSEKSSSGLVGGDAHKMYKQLKNMKDMMGSKVAVRAMAYALAICEQNACMGRIVAFPTAGGSGVIPGVLISASKHFHAGKRKLLHGMFAASAVGLVIAEGATLSAA
jgi:L-serine dehydratase